MKSLSNQSGLFSRFFLKTGGRNQSHLTAFGGSYLFDQDSCVFCSWSHKNDWASRAEGDGAWWEGGGMRDSFQTTITSHLQGSISLKLRHKDVQHMATRRHRDNCLWCLAPLEHACRLYLTYDIRVSETAGVLIRQIHLHAIMSLFFDSQTLSGGGALHLFLNKDIISIWRSHYSIHIYFVSISRWLHCGCWCGIQTTIWQPTHYK